MPANDSALQREITVLYSDHHGWLRGWLRKRLGDMHQAADLAHDTFMQLLTREEPVAAREPRAYLAALAALPEPVAQSAEERAIVLETLGAVDRMLDGLALPVRRAFLMSQLDDMSHADIADTLGISVTTVKRYLVKAGQQCYFGAHGVSL